MGHVFLVAWGSWRPAGLLEHPWAFLNKFGGGPKEVYADFFGILTSVEDATNERLERELESGCKWISLISDEGLSWTIMAGQI